MTHSYHVEPVDSKLAARLETVKARRTMKADLDSIFSQVATPATRTAGLNALHAMLARVCLGNDPKDVAVWFQPEVIPINESPVDLHRTISTRPESHATLAEQTEQMLNVVQGLCLMHEKTRGMFKRGENMKIILRLLEDPSKINSNLLQMALDTLTAILVDSSENIRVAWSIQDLRLFERIGMATVTKLLENRNVDRCARMKCIEFLYFYLMPEKSYLQPNVVETRLSGAMVSRSKTSEEKREFLKKYLPTFVRVMTPRS
ncbi:cell division control protein 14, SIN component-domain-containing protein [Endogone sp. FLAS-F59071]|nr:cell division control protein 14, SIN component-domain-containing protein [Endogone sp. FLAS-F59071]|eukprot:RUS20729.1 cell division control protein 14, SIN component-domain-containing protein [Endogone sp. FLAS-F59071]